MRKNIIAFGVAIGVLIIAVSAWIVFDKFFHENNRAKSLSGFFGKNENPQMRIAVNPDSAEKQGERALADRDFSAAVGFFTQAVQENESDVVALTHLAEAQIGLKNYAKAQRNLLKAEDLDATYSGIFIQRGKILLREEKFLEASREFAKGGKGADLWQGLMLAFFDKSTEAKNLLTPLLEPSARTILQSYSEYERYPDSPKLHIDTLLTRAFNQIGEYELAIAKIQPVLATNPDYRDAWLLLGYAQFAKEDYVGAKQSWETAYALDKAKPETQYFIGLVNFELGDFITAEKFLALAKENRFMPDGLEEKLAEAYFKQEKFQEAAMILKDYLEKNPEAKIEKFVRAIYLYLEKLGDGKEAWHLADLALQRYPENALAYNFAGWVSLDNKFFPEAKSQLEKAISLDQTLPWPHYNLGLYYEQTGNLKAALDKYAKTYNLDPSGSVGALAAANYNRLIDKQKQ